VRLTRRRFTNESASSFSSSNTVEYALAGVVELSSLDTGKCWDYTVLAAKARRGKACHGWNDFCEFFVKVV